MLRPASNNKVVSSDLISVAFPVLPEANEHSSNVILIHSFYDKNLNRLNHMMIQFNTIFLIITVIDNLKDINILSLSTSGQYVPDSKLHGGPGKCQYNSAIIRIHNLDNRP